jgi:uncharacterized membrane protein
MSKLYKIIFISFIFFLNSVFVAPQMHAQELIQDKIEIVKSKVVEILKEEKGDIAGRGIESTNQTIKIEILEGEQKGRIVIMENDYIILEKDDKFFLQYSVDKSDGQEYFSVKETYRQPIVLFFIALFVVVVLFFSGKQGIRSLLGLAGSFFVIIYVLVPSLLSGYPPVLISIIVATIILFFAIYFTHGFNRVSTAAFSGTVLAVVATGVLAYVGVTLASFTGFAAEESFYLNVNTKGALDFRGLLLGGIMIGVLGVLDDIAITQASIVRELYVSAPNLSRKEIYKKALRIGKDHVGALINTLALAYTGASLPLLLLFSSSSSTGVGILNQEIFATEIIRTIVGSIGLILTVPITTLFAVYMLKGYEGNILPDNKIIHY